MIFKLYVKKTVHSNQLPVSKLMCPYCDLSQGYNKFKEEPKAADRPLGLGPRNGH